MANNEAPICVIIAARNAAASIGRAISSALAEPEVGEVIVVDDASTDGTAVASRLADDGTGRLDVIELSVNGGPAAARNLAIRQSRLPLISILDADDFLIAGRFSAMLATDDWDLIADNVMFIAEGADAGAARLPGVVPRFMTEPTFLNLPAFVDGNISRPNTHRAELGFLKPLLRRSFLDAHKLAYDETLRLGEDYELYVRALMLGARFKVIKSCGYGAVVRPDSLSGRHSVADLARLADADLRLLADSGLDAASRRALERHERHVRNKLRLRRFLEIKGERGIAAALRYGLASPANALPIGQGVLRARLRRLQQKSPETPRQPPAPRFLLPGRAIEREVQG